MELFVLSQTTCAPCKILKNYLKNEEVEFTEININVEPEAVEKYGITSTPVTILMDGEEEIVRVHGFAPDQLEDLIEQL